MKFQILEEFGHMTKCIKNDRRNGIDEINIARHIDIAVGSIINNLIFGYRFDGVSL